jgi:hypothetical protein
MVAQTYVDAIGAMAAWINSRTETLVGYGNPLQMGAHLKKLAGGEPATYAFMEELFSTRSEDGAENPDMMASLAAQVYGGTREAAGAAAVALAEELSTQLCGCQAAVAGAVLFVSDDIQGPSWSPDGDAPRMLLNWTVRMRPA